MTPPVDLLLRQTIRLRGHFSAPVTVEGLRPLGNGVKDRQFGYVGPGRSAELTNLSERGGYLVNARLVRIGVEVPQEEIDVGSAFLVIPAGYRE